MSQQLFLTLESNRHGTIEGSVTQSGFENLISVFSTTHAVTSATSVTGRRARGKNQHGPLIITKAIDKASVLIYDCWNTNDRFKRVKIESYATGEDGSVSLFYSIELENARISAIRQQLANPALTELTQLEEVAFEYQTITWRFAEGNLEAISELSGAV